MGGRIFGGGKYGEHALHRAAAGGHVDIIRYLVEKKSVDPNVTDSLGRTAVDMACKSFLANRALRNEVVNLLQNLQSQWHKHDNTHQQQQQQQQG